MEEQMRSQTQHSLPANVAPRGYNVGPAAEKGGSDPVCQEAGPPSVPAFHYIRETIIA